jgi:hypothetical protein
MPLRGSPTPIGCIYDVALDADGGLLAVVSHQGHQVFQDPCLDLDVYNWAMGVSLLTVSIERLPNHILLSGLELLEGLFAPSPTNSLGTAFMAAYLASPPSPGSASSRSGVPMAISSGGVFTNMGGIGTKGGASVSHMSCSGDPMGISTANILAPPAISTRLQFYRSLHSVPGGLPVYHPPSLAAFVGSGIPPPLVAFSEFAGASLPGSPPLPTVRRPDPEEEVLITPCSH